MRGPYESQWFVCYLIFIERRLIAAPYVPNTL